MSSRRERLLTTLRGALAGDPVCECTAIGALAKVEACDRESVARLIERLDARDPDVRMEAVAALGKLRIEAAIASLLDLMERDSDGDVRIQAVIALGKIASPTVVERLIRCIREDGYPELDLMTDDTEFGYCWEVQLQAINALGEIGDRRAAQPLSEFLKRQDDGDLQELGCSVLARLDDDAARAFVLHQLEDGAPRQRRAAVSSLVAGAATHQPKMVAAVVRRLADDDPRVRLAALRYVAERREIGLVIALLRDPDSDVRSEAALKVGKQGDATNLTTLHEMAFDDPDPAVRHLVVRIIGDVGSPESLPTLRELLESDDVDLLREAAVALTRIDVGGCEERLVQIFDDNPHCELRLACVTALGIALQGSNGDEEQSAALDLLERAAIDSDERIALAAMSALTQIDPKTAIERLIGYLLRSRTGDGQIDELVEPEDDTGERVSHVPDLIEVKDVTDTENPAFDEWVSSQEDRDPKTSTLGSILERAREVDLEREEQSEPAPPTEHIPVLAARLLGQTEPHDESTAAALMEAARTTQDDRLRRECIEALGLTGHRAALPLVLEALDSEKREMRLTAINALGRIGCDKEHLLDLLEDEDSFVRERAVSALDGSRDAAPMFARALADSDQQVCRAAMGALCRETLTPEVRAAMLGALVRHNGELNKDAASALARMDESCFTDALLQKLRDSQDEARWIYIDAIGEIHEALGEETT